MATLEELDEALAHAKRVPIEDRGTTWWAFVDKLLEQRARLARTDEQARETRVVFSAEAR